MDTNTLRQLLENVANGKITTEDATNKLKDLPFENLGFAHVDHHRALRTGYPEVIFCQGKSKEQVYEIAKRIHAKQTPVLATRVCKDIGQQLVSQFELTEYDEVARTVFIPGPNTPKHVGRVLVVSAGTSDLPIAREALVTAHAMGSNVESIYDVGVAGIHRLLAYREKLNSATVVVVVAGMEGALASVVGGLVNVPVIAVPTSIGYGANLGGLSALLTMLNSCASGVTVVNIDNGFGGGFAAAMINNQSDHKGI